MEVRVLEGLDDLALVLLEGHLDPLHRGHVQSFHGGPRPNLIFFFKK